MQWTEKKVTQCRDTLVTESAQQRLSEVEEGAGTKVTACRNGGSPVTGNRNNGLLVTGSRNGGTLVAGKRNCGTPVIGSRSGGTHVIESRSSCSRNAGTPVTSSRTGRSPVTGRPGSRNGDTSGHRNDTSPVNEGRSFSTILTGSRNCPTPVAGARWHGKKLSCTCGHGRLDLIKVSSLSR